MRPLLVLVAAVGLPLCALAKPVADDRRPIEVSEVAVEAQRAPECPAARRSRLGPPSRVFNAPRNTNGRRTEESAGTRAFVLRLAAGFANGDVDDTQMAPGLAKAARRQAPGIRPYALCLGAFKRMRFLHVSQAGWDDFAAEFSNGAVEFAIAPLDSHEQVRGAAMRGFYPQPASRQVEAWLTSIERGRPDYANLTPEAASKLQARWPALQTSRKDWGRLKEFRFVGQEDGGAYVYLATYEHRRVVWTAFPPDTVGKLTGLTYAEGAG